MQTETAPHGVPELSGEAQLNKIGQCSKCCKNQKETYKLKACYFCGSVVNSPIIEHFKSCKTKKSKCNNCKRMRHYEQVCRNEKISETEPDNLERGIQQIHTHNDYGAEIFKIDLLRINVRNTHQTI